MLIVEGIDVTPNPNAIKFILNKQLLKRESRNYKNATEASNDEFASKIFTIEGIVSVFYMDKFVTVEKTPESVWGNIQKEFARLISTLDVNIIPAEKDAEISENINTTDLLQKINEVLDYRVRPALAADGGGLEVVGLEGYTLAIKYHGACGSCPSAIRGTLVAIENLLRKEVHSEIMVIPG